MEAMKKITVWLRLDVKTDQWNHHHVTDGHSEETEPTPMSDEQKQNWKGAEWRRFHAYVDDTGKLVDFA